MEHNNQDNQKQDHTHYMPIGMCIGIGVGMAIGAAMDNIPIGMCMGLSIGMAIGAIADSRKKTAEGSSESQKKEEE